MIADVEANCSIFKKFAEYHGGPSNKIPLSNKSDYFPYEFWRPEIGFGRLKIES
jgi:hypothetical protein